jgi:hypothetical protein
MCSVWSGSAQIQAAYWSPPVALSRSVADEKQGYVVSPFEVTLSECRLSAQHGDTECVLLARRSRSVWSKSVPLRLFVTDVCRHFIRSTSLTSQSLVEILAAVRILEFRTFPCAHATASVV